MLLKRQGCSSANFLLLIYFVFHISEMKTNLNFKGKVGAVPSRKVRQVKGRAAPEGPPSAVARQQRKTAKSGRIMATNYSANQVSPFSISNVQFCLLDFTFGLPFPEDSDYWMNSWKWGEIIFFTSLAPQGREGPRTNERYLTVKFVGWKWETSRVFSVKGQRISILFLGPSDKIRDVGTARENIFP